MFHKIIKRGGRKHSKSSAIDPDICPYGPAGYRSAGPANSHGVTVNHASRSSAGPNSPSADRPHPLATVAGCPHDDIVEILPLFCDVPAPDRPALFIRKLHLGRILFDFSDTLNCPREKETKRQTLIELVEFVHWYVGA